MFKIMESTGDHLVIIGEHGAMTLPRDQWRELRSQVDRFMRKLEEDSADIPACDRVAAGMAWLDEHYPDHVERFNPDKFHIMCWGMRDCVLIQARGVTGWTEDSLWTESALMRNLGLDRVAVGRMGFMCYSSMDEEVNELNQAWLDAYAARREE